MPGNEVGDRVHNFFGQENLYQGQHQSQAADGNWQGLSNGMWAGSQRQIGAPFVSNLKNFNAPQSDSEGGHGSWSSHTPHGLNAMQSSLGPDFSRGQAQYQQKHLNGYVQGNQIFQTRPHEANLLGMGTISDRQNPTSRDLTMHEADHLDGPENEKKLIGLETAESPVSFDFFGGQQQMDGGHLNVMQSLRRQQSGISEMQLLQQQAVYSQIQELQRQQQFQQLEARNHSLMHQVSSIKQVPGHHTPDLINGVPVKEIPNYPWQPDHMAGNTNLLQGGVSPAMQGSPSGFMLHSEQNQAPRLMGSIPQQIDQSLYGVPISTGRNISGQNSLFQVDKPAMQQLSASNNSFPGNKYTAFSDQASLQDGTSVMRQDFQGKGMFGMTTGHGINGLNSENLQQLSSQQRTVPIPEFHGRQELARPVETSEERTVMQVSSSQNVATLDPTEEKILYGSDDNLWDAFGRTTNLGTGGYTMLDGMVFDGAFPSLQSGTWSALMQSAVAETSSGDVGLQEEWSGVSRNAEPQNGNQPSATLNDSGKLQTICADSNLQNASTLNSASVSVSLDGNRPNTCTNFSGFQQPGLVSSVEHVESFRTNTAPRSVSQFPEAENRWLDRNLLQNPLADGSRLSANTNHSLGAERKENNVPGAWTRQQSLSPFGNDDQRGKPNGWNFIESLSGDGNLKYRENQNPLSTPQGSDHSRAMCEEMVQSTGMEWTANATSNLNADMLHTNIGLPRVYNEDSSVNDDAAIPNTSFLRANHESRQQHSDNHNHALWKDVDSSVKSKGHSFLGKYQNHLDKSLQNFDTSGNGDQDRQAAEMHEMENSTRRENSLDSFRSSIPHHNSAGGLQENIWSDNSEKRRLPGSKDKSSGIAGQKPSVMRKFQYHPMGNLEVSAEPSYETKHAMQSRATTQQHSFINHEQGSLGQSNSGFTERNSLEVEKGDGRILGEIPSKRMQSGFVPIMSAKFDNSVGNDASDKTPPSSQNMLELLNKVDQQREYGSRPHFRPSNSNPSGEMPQAETSDGTVGQTQHSQSSASQSFGLQLGPPSQQLFMPDSTFSHRSSQTVQNSSHATGSMIGGNVNRWLVPATSIQSFATSHGPQEDFRKSLSGPSGHAGNTAPRFSAQENSSAAFASGLLYSRSHLQNENKTLNKAANVTSNKLDTHSGQSDYSCERVGASQPASAQGISGTASQINLAPTAEVSQRLNIADISHAQNQADPVQESDSLQPSAFSKGSPSEWVSVTSRQPGSQPLRAGPNLFKSYLQSNNNLERSFSGPKEPNSQDTQELVNSPAAACSMNSQSFVGREQPVKEISGQQLSAENSETLRPPSSTFLGKESFGNYQSDASPSIPSTAQGRVEALGRSIRPNNNLNQHFPMAHQMQAMKSSEVNQSNWGDRFKGPDGNVDPQQGVTAKGAQHLAYGQNNMMVRESPNNHSPISSGDSKMLSFSSNVGNGQDINTSIQDATAFGQNTSHNFSCSTSTSVRGEKSQISPQMAPSWFDQYGTFKNGQMLSVYGHENSNIKSVNHSLMIGKPPDSLSAPNLVKQAHAAVNESQLGDTSQSSELSTKAHENFSSSHLLPSGVTDQGLAVVRPKKRKSLTYELIPWNKELTEGSHGLQNISRAEVNWAQAVNRLIEKIEDEAELTEDALVLYRPKKRLILTKQLMQQVFSPPPFTFLSADASSHCESVAYLVARIALGDGCSAVSCSGSDAAVLPESTNDLPGKLKSSAKVGDQHFVKVMEDFIARAMNLESDLLRVEKRVSILDLRVECQDLEKFSVINRFAKFHSRGQADGGEASASDATASSQKICPQRYVTALPMPRNLPDRVQCLSL